jgi:hypothetical protein
MYNPVEDSGHITTSTTALQKTTSVHISSLRIFSLDYRIRQFPDSVDSSGFRSERTSLLKNWDSIFLRRPHLENYQRTYQHA